MSRRENSPGPKDHLELDLWTGEIRNRTDGRPDGQLSPWKRWAQIIGPEMFLATHLGRSGLPLLDMTLLWASWLKSARSLPHIRNMFNTPRCGMNNALRPYGWFVDEIGIMRWAVKRVDEHSAGHAAIAAEKALGPFRKAYDGVAHADYATALASAVEALRYCGESRYARLLIGMCHFVHGASLDQETAVDTAAYLGDVQANLQLAIRVLSRLWREEQRRRPQRWQLVPEFIQECEEQLATYDEMFKKAHEFLRGA